MGFGCGLPAWIGEAEQHERTCGRSRILGLHAGLTEGFNGGAGRATGGAVLFNLIAVMSR